MLIILQRQEIRYGKNMMLDFTLCCECGMNMYASTLPSLCCNNFDRCCLNKPERKSNSIFDVTHNTRLLAHCLQNGVTLITNISFLHTHLHGLLIV